MIGLDTTFLVAVVQQEHPRHDETADVLRGWLESGESLCLCAHVVAEYLHIVTDSRRFESPLSMVQAFDHAELFMSDTASQWVETTDAIVLTAMDWMAQHRLGRKRILDTFIATTYSRAGAEHLATLNPADFKSFGLFEFLPSTDV